jgi:predicted helicase
MPLLSEVTLLHSVGVVTARDHLTIAFTSDEIWERVQRFAKMAEEDAREEFGLRNDVRDWKVSLAQDDLRSKPLSKNRVKPILYRPFDTRFIYYTGKNKGFIGQPAAAIMSHMIGVANVGLMTTRKVEIGTFGHAICANIMTESHSVSLKEVNYLFPLWLYPDGSDLSLSKERRPNFTRQFLEAVATSLSLRQAGPYGLPQGTTPEDIFHYAYGVFHSPDYRSRYAEFLKIDFPRLPLTGNLELFRALGRLGGELTALHLMESPKLEQPITEYLGGRGPEVEKISWSKNTVWLDKAQTTGFAGVPEAVYNFHIGGYQVCEKWLKDRKGRTLSAGEIAHYHKIVVALSETIRLMSEIDSVIETHGGWPLK